MSPLTYTTREPAAPDSAVLHGKAKPKVAGHRHHEGNARNPNDRQHVARDKQGRPSPGTKYSDCAHPRRARTRSASSAKTVILSLLIVSLQAQRPRFLSQFRPLKRSDWSSVHELGGFLHHLVLRGGHEVLAEVSSTANGRWPGAVTSPVSPTNDPLSITSSLNGSLIRVICTGEVLRASWEDALAWIASLRRWIAPYAAKFGNYKHCARNLGQHVEITMLGSVDG